MLLSYSSIMLTCMWGRITGRPKCCVQNLESDGLGEKLWRNLECSLEGQWGKFKDFSFIKLSPRSKVFHIILFLSITIKRRIFIIIIICLLEKLCCVSESFPLGPFCGCTLENHSYADALSLTSFIKQTRRKMLFQVPFQIVF